MAKARTSGELTCTVTLQLDEREARAVLEMSKYDPKKVLGAVNNVARMEEHEEGFISLLEYFKSEIGPQLYRADQAREVFKGTKRAMPPEVKVG